MKGFLRTFPIRFEHCDPAGIMFFPRFFMLVNATVEDWFGQELGQSFKALHIDQRKGVPTVQFACDFKLPLRLGDEVSMQLRIGALGLSSCQLRVEAWLNDAQAARFEQTIVYTDLDTMKSEPWPDDLRAAMTRFAAESA